MPNAIIAGFINCNFTDDELLAYISKEDEPYVRGVFLNSQANNPLLHQLIQEVRDKHKEIFLEIGNKPELHAGAGWNSVRKTILIDHLRFGKNANLIVNIIIFELCNSVNSYMDNLGMFLEDSEKSKSHPESGALLYELAEYYSVQRYQCVAKEMLQNASGNSPTLVDEISRAMDIIQHKFQKGLMSTKYYWKLFNKRQVNENAPHAHYYLNQLASMSMVNKYSKKLDTVARDTIDDLLNNMFNQQQYNIYKNRVESIYKEIKSVFNPKEDCCFLMAENVCLFEMYNVLLEDEIAFYKDKLKTIADSVLSYGMFALEISDLFVKIVKDRLYENNFAVFSSIPEEKTLIKTFLNIVYDLSLDDDNTVSDVICKYDSILQDIKNHVPQLAEKYSLSLGYDLLAINKEKARRLQIQQEILESKEIKELFCSYVYLKSWLTQWPEAGLLKQQETVLFSEVYNNGKPYISEHGSESYEWTFPKPPLAICWHKPDLTF